MHPHALRPRPSDLLWLGLILSAPTVVFAQASPGDPEPGLRRITLDEAIEQSVRRNADLEMARSEEAMARAQARAATAPLYPRVDVELGYAATNDPVGVFGTKLRQGTFGMDDLAIEALNDPDAIDDFTARVRASWAVGSAQIWAAREAARHRASSVEWQTRRIREATELQTRVLYYDAARSEARVRAAAGAAEAAEATLERFRSRHEQGVLNRADLLQARAEQSAAQAELVQARARRRNARVRLAVHLGWEEGVLAVPTDTFSPPEVPQGGAPDPAARSDLRARSAAVEAAEAATDRARFGYVPTLHAFASYELHDGDHPLGAEGTNWSVGVMLRWTLFGGFQRAAEVEQARARAHAARVGYEHAVREAHADVRTARRSIAAAVEAVRATEAALQAAQEGRDLMRRRFEEGLATASDLLQAESRVIAMRARHIDALAGYHIATAQLRFAMGGQLEEVSP